MGFRDKISDSLKHAYNVFTNQDPKEHTRAFQHGPSYSIRQDRVRRNYSNEKTIISGIYTRMSIDLSNVIWQHVRLDPNRRYIETINSGLNDCLTVEANLDQGAQAFRQDVAATLFDKGAIAIVPVETNIPISPFGGFDIRSIRVAEIVQWYPKHVQVNLYNEATGLKQLMTFHKKEVAIVENPFYEVMNEPNSILQRLLRKLNLLDAVDEQSGSGKLDLIIQLPYVVKSEVRRDQAKKRMADIEEQLKGPYGVAYTDGTEKITQLNRPVENNMMKQIEYLTNMLYGQLGVTESIIDGTADEQTMVNYQNRTLEPILNAIMEAMARSFLTKTARSQGQSITYYINQFKGMTVSTMAEIADVFSRNAIVAPNEFRQELGYRPVDDPAADKLVNRNMPVPGISAPGASPTDLGELPVVPSIKSGKETSK